MVRALAAKVKINYMYTTLTVLQTIRNYQYESTLKIIAAAKKLGKLSVGHVCKVVTLAAEIVELQIEDFSLCIDDHINYLRENLCPAAAIVKNREVIIIKFK